MMTGNDGAGKIANRIHIELGSVFEGGYAASQFGEVLAAWVHVKYWTFSPLRLRGFAASFLLRREFSPKPRSRKGGQRD